MRIFKIILIVFFILSLFISCGKKSPTSPASPKGSISDYVTLSVSGSDPAFIFLKESEENAIYEYSNIEYNVFGNKTSFDLLATFDNGHIYDIYCSNINRVEHYDVTGYRAEIKISWGGKTISGTLIYGDYISIESVDPSTGLVSNTSTLFEIVVEYALSSLDEAKIDVCFNDGDQINHFYPKETRSVTKGSGEHTFALRVTAKDWGEEGDFELRIYLYDENHIILSSDDTVLLFE